MDYETMTRGKKGNVPAFIEMMYLKKGDLRWELHFILRIFT